MKRVNYFQNNPSKNVAAIIFAFVVALSAMILIAYNVVTHWNEVISDFH